MRLHYSEDLPISQKRSEIQALIDAHQVVIVAGETGSGKTSQLPKMCLELAKRQASDKTIKIAHTQPRRLAARMVATRIAEECQISLGQEVGFQVRFSQKLQASTQICLMTDGILLAQTRTDPLLSQYNYIIIDEVHERTLNIDCLLGLLKDILRQRIDLKLIITSATLEPERYAHYFGGAPVLIVQGRTYPVTLMYRSFEHDITQAYASQLQVILNELFCHGLGDVLMFLPSEREIRSLGLLLQDKLRDMEICPLYARLNASEQQKIFQKSHKLKLVLATNIAETSLTVPGIRYVIDSGLARIARYNHRTQTRQLPIEPISQASANQRAGRCGRTQPGICVRLYDQDDFEARPLFTEPEILRTHLTAVILQMLSLGIKKPEQFSFLDPPESRAWREGFALLERIGAISRQRELTPLGRQLIRLPIEPWIGAMLISSAKERALTELLIISAFLSVPDPRIKKGNNLSHEFHAEFKDETSDFLSYLKIWRWFQEQKQNLSRNRLKKLCLTLDMSYIHLSSIDDIHQQLEQCTKKMGFLGNEQEASSESIHRCILTGIPFNIGHKRLENRYLGLRNTKFQIFPGSNLAAKPPEWLCYFERIETHKVYALTNALISAKLIKEINKQYLVYAYSEPQFVANQKRVLAVARASLFGLELPPHSRVDFGKVDPKSAREIFIYEGLVAKPYQEFAFIKANRALQQKLEQLEQRVRRPLVLTDLELYNFYAERIPADICSGLAFEHWLEQIALDHLSYPEPQIEQLDELYPETLLLHHEALRLEYQFSPGELEDGVTLFVPLLKLNDLRENQLQNLVPAWCFAVCECLIKALPKELRQQLPSVRETLVILKNHLAAKSDNLALDLSNILYRETKLRVQPEDWRWQALPNSLRVLIKVYDPEGRVLAVGHDLATIKTNCAHLIQSTLNEASVELSDPAVRWPEKSEIRPGQWEASSGPFWALSCVGSALHVKAYLLKSEAYQAHVKGCVHLFFLQESQLMARLQKKYGREKHFLTLGFYLKSAELLDDFILSCLREAAIELNLVWPLDKATFHTFSQQVKPRLGLVLDKMSEHLKTWVHKLPELQASLAALSQVKTLQPSLLDMKTQIDQLVYPGFFWELSTEIRKRLAIYIFGLQQRISKLKQAPQRDAQLVQQLRVWLERFERDQIKLKALDLEQWQTLKLALEEMRLSLFAQPVKTLFPISMKRLERLWHEPRLLELAEWLKRST